MCVIISPLYTSFELIFGINPTASISTPDDAVPAAQEQLNQLFMARSDAQQALQKRIKPLNIPRTFIPGDKVSPALNLVSHRGEVRRGNRAISDAIRAGRLGKLMIMD